MISTVAPKACNFLKRFILMCSPSLLVSWWIRCMIALKVWSWTLHSRLCRNSIWCRCSDFLKFICLPWRFDSIIGIRCSLITRSSWLRDVILRIYRFFLVFNSLSGGIGMSLYSLQVINWFSRSRMSWRKVYRRFLRGHTLIFRNSSIDLIFIGLKWRLLFIWTIRLSANNRFDNMFTFYRNCRIRLKNNHPGFHLLLCLLEWGLRILSLILFSLYHFDYSHFSWFLLFFFILTQLLLF